MALAPVRRMRRVSVSAECALPGDASSPSSSLLPTEGSLDADVQELRCILASHFLFGALQSDAAWESLSRCLCVIQVEPNADVVKQGDDGHDLYIVKSGRYQVVKDGVELEVQYSQRGDLFGELALMYNSPRAATVRAMDTPGELWVLSRQHFASMLSNVRGEWRSRVLASLRQAAPRTFSARDLELVADHANDVVYSQGAKLRLPFFLVLQGEVRVDSPERVLNQGMCFLVDRQQTTTEPVCVVRSSQASLAALDVAATLRLRHILCELVSPAPVQASQENRNVVEKAPAARQRNRRVSVSAEVPSLSFPEGTKLELLSWEKTLFDEAMTFFVFSALSPSERDLVQSHLRGPLSYALGESIVTQGEPGDCVFIVRQGVLGVKINGALLENVVYRPGNVFGELALLYSAPRAATVLVTSPEGATIWSLDRQIINGVVIAARAKRRMENEAIVRSVSLFEAMTPSELARLVDVLQDDVCFENEQVVVVQGDKDLSKMKLFIIVEGRVQVLVNGSLVRDLSQGDFFGEIGLLGGSARTATVKAVGALRCAAVDLAAFERVLGPLKEIQRRLLLRKQMYL